MGGHGPIGGCAAFPTLEDFNLVEIFCSAMPVDSGHKMPKDEAFKVLPADVYNVSVADVEYEIKPSPFKNEDGSTKPDTRQYKFKFLVEDEGEFKGQSILAWIRESLLPPSKNSKNPTLPEFLKVVTGEKFGADDNEKVSGEFMNSLVGSKLRVTTKVEAREDGREFTKVVSYMAVK